jgi:N-methylhydantoinase A/oxoprolinase/acetone carboxylase beta subunit
VISLEEGVPGDFDTELDFNGGRKYDGGGPLKVRCDGEWLDGRSYAREDLEPGAIDEGPLVITDYSSCVFVPPLWRIACRRDGWLEMRHNLPEAAS